MFGGLCCAKDIRIFYLFLREGHYFWQDFYVEFRNFEEAIFEGRRFYRICIFFLRKRFKNSPIFLGGAAEFFCVFFGASSTFVGARGGVV